MKNAQESIAERRQSTNASLQAERASAVIADGGAARARRLAEDLIERERLTVDEQLRKFRDDADTRLADERLGSRPPRESVTSERARADKATGGERAVNDAILQQERQRSDDAIHKRDEDAPHSPERARRAETDEKLGAERLRVDRAVSLLGSTEKALSIAEQEVERRSHVLAMVAHELRNPLAVVMMNTDFISDGLVDPGRREAAEEVRCSVARMERLLMDLLDVARIEAGILRIVKRPFDMGALMSEIHAAYGPLFAKRGVTFECGPRAPGIVVTFDHDRIVQVLSNLLTNAMKFTPTGGKVSVRIEPGIDNIELAVTDTGAGIPSHALPSVFNRFWQASSEPGAGLGLGLYICERIVAAHAGRIWVESEVGTGTTFRLTLPKPPAAE